MRLPPPSSRQAGRTRTSRVRLAILLAASTVLATSLTALSLPSAAQPVGLGPVRDAGELAAALKAALAAVDGGQVAVLDVRVQPGYDHGTTAALTRHVSES